MRVYSIGLHKYILLHLTLKGGGREWWRVMEGVMERGGSRVGGSYGEGREWMQRGGRDGEGGEG
jgi:hypothetical protein